MYVREALEAQLPMPKDRLQRARYNLLIDYTFLINIPLDNVLHEVMVMTLPLPRILEVGEVLVTMFHLEMTGIYRKPTLRKVVISNVIDHCPVKD